MAWLSGGSGNTEGKAEEKQPSAVASAANALHSYADDLSSRTSKLLGLQEKSKLEQLEDELCSCCPTMSYQQRIAGYCTCLFLSFCLTIGAATRLGELLAGDPAPFAIFFTFQNVVAICGSFFLSGPAAQCKKMCDSSRFIATTLYFVSMVATLFFAFYTGLPGGAQIGLIILFIFVQWIALLWYTLSFIPYAREYICTCCHECCHDAFCKCDCLKGGDAA
mmetsp:Transcript_17091/g.53388  ORF Transcript_17091/g.53388 Transcript_17091/m.53388 type:complete len:221 (+) Transcript_17091:29-691(+)